MFLPGQNESINIRVANFSNIELHFNNLLNFDFNDSETIVKRIRKYADLPYVFVFPSGRKQLIIDLLLKLKSIRSPCYPYALFLIDDSEFYSDGGDIDIIKISSPDPENIKSKIEEYATSKCVFDYNKLKINNTGSLPKIVDVVIVGAGVTGLYAANKLLENGSSFCVVDKREMVGGIWSMYANDTSQVNTSEGAYRLIEKTSRSNRDHSTTREILEDIAQVSKNISKVLYLDTNVDWIKKADDLYRISLTRNQTPYTLESKGVILAINDRVGTPREIQWKNQNIFQGDIIAGISNEPKGFDWKDKKVAIVGMGAFAVENARTALEEGASHVTVVCRRHGTVCPKIIDYLNFSTPYDEDFKHDKKSNMRNMMFWKKLYNQSGATQPECWMGKIKHEGHTISVSDIWFIGHYLKKIDTITGNITGMYENGIIVDNQRHIDADVVVNCVGFHRNALNLGKICDYKEMYNNNYVDKDMIYLADAYIDDDAFNSFFGSSVLEMIKFYMDVYIHFFNNPDFDTMIKSDGIEKISIADRKWSHYIAGAISLVKNYPDIHEIAKKQVAQRTKNFLESHDLETYISENRREWIDTHSLLAGKTMKEEDCLPYVFQKLADKKL
jgi:siroheme synthase (precorrin-2 oxidase/ferrochelatase)